MNRRDAFQAAMVAAIVLLLATAFAHRKGTLQERKRLTAHHATVFADYQQQLTAANRRADAAEDELLKLKGHP